MRNVDTVDKRLFPRTWALSGKAERYRFVRVGRGVCAGVVPGRRGAGETIHAAAIQAMTHGPLIRAAMTYLAWNCQMNQLVSDQELGYVSSSWSARYRLGGRDCPGCCSL